jgi:hypothetical protein
VCVQEHTFPTPMDKCACGLFVNFVCMGTAGGHAGARVWELSSRGGDDIQNLIIYGLGW